MNLDKVPLQYWPVLLAVAAMVVAFAWDTPMTLDVSATTEVVSATLSADDLRWQFTNVSIRRGGGREEAFSGAFQPSRGARVWFRRLAAAGLDIRLEPPGGGVAGTLETGARAEAVQGALTIHVPAGERVVVPVEGTMEIGERLTGDQQRPAFLLEQGRIRLLGHTLFRDRLFDAGSYELTAGDVVKATNVQGVGFGFVTPAERGLRAGYRVVARNAQVSRFGSARAYEIAVPWTERIAKDGDFQMTLTIAGILVIPGSAWAARKAPKKARGAAAAIVLGLAAAGNAGAELVLIEAEGIAQGITFEDRGDCLIAAPAHAIGTPRSIRVATQRAQSQAAVEQTLADDIVVLRIQSNAAQFCREPWPVHEYREDAPAPADMQIRTVKTGGVITTMPVVQEHSNYRAITLRPARSGDGFQEQMSGSALVAGNRVVGMLMSVKDGRGNALRIGYIDSLLQPFVNSRKPPLNLSGIWSLVPEVGGRMRGGEETLVKVEQLGNEVKVWLHQPGPDLGQAEGWSTGMKIWDGVLDGRQGTVSGYARLPGRAAAGADVYRQFVPFRSSAEGDTVATELVLAEAGRDGGGVRLSSRRVSLHRSQGRASATRQETTEAPRQSRNDGFASGQDAIRALRQTFSKLGYQDVPGPRGTPVRYETVVREFNDASCELVMEERMHMNPQKPYAQQILEITYLQLAGLDADQIKATSGQLGPFPANSWVISVPAAGPAIRVEQFEAYGQDVKRVGDGKPDEVFFYLRYPQFAEDAARALRALARACGAR